MENALAKARWWIAVASILLCVVRSDCADFRSTQINGEEWNRYYEKVRRTCELKLRARNQLLFVGYQVSYVFTQPGHPAHPAVIKHARIDDDTGHVEIREAYYAGDRSKFEHWLQRFAPWTGRIP